MCKVDPSTYARILQSGLRRVIAAESDVTRYDSLVGDGDCGIGLRRGAEAILTLLSSEPPTADLLHNLILLGRSVENNMDGTSGALYAIFMNALVANLRATAPAASSPVTVSIWASALRRSLEGLGRYTPAQVGDRTLVDALEPFVRVLGEKEDLRLAAEAAREGTESTKGMRASLGRSVYVGGDDWKNVPDPGAYGLSEFLLGLADGL